MNQSTTHSTEFESYFERISPLVLETLQQEFPHLPEAELRAIQSLSLAACLTVFQNEPKKQSDRTIRQCTRDQVLVWGLAHSSPSRQSAAYQQVMTLYGPALRSDLQRRHTFRTTDVVDDILSETLEVLTRKVAEEVPITSLRNYLLGIAQNKARKHFEKAGKIPPHKSLETPFVDVEQNENEPDDAEDQTEGIRMDDPQTADDPDSIDLFLPEPTALPEGSESTAPPETTPPKLRRFRINFRQLQLTLADCLGRLTERRQLLIRLRYLFWKGYEGKLTAEQIVSSHDGLGMDQIAKLADYKDARTANSRLTENRQSLRDCLESKLNLTFPKP